MRVRHRVKVSESERVSPSERDVGRETARESEREREWGE